MAVIGKIRKHSGLLVIVIGVALAAFVLGDFSKGNPRKGNNLGEVNGEEITYQDFNRRLENNIEIEKNNKGVQALTPEESFNIRQQTWNQYLNEIIMGEQFDEVGVTVTSDELFELVQGKEPHRYILQYFKDPQTGIYDPSLVLNYLKNLEQMDQKSVQQWLQFEQAIKADQLNQKYNNLISKAYYVPAAFAKDDYELKNNKASIKILAKKFGSVSDSLISFTDADLEKYYQENIETYKALEEVRAMDYVMFEVQPSLNDRVETTKEVNDLFAEFKELDDAVSFVNAVSDSRYDSTFYIKGELPIQLDEAMFNSEVGSFVEPFLDNDIYRFAKLMDIQYRPDSMMASHVLIAYQGAYSADPQITRTREQAKAMADSIRTVLKANSNKISDLAKELSNDPSAVNNSGDLGWFADFGMLWPFNNAVYKAKVGEITMAETQFGYHIIKVTGKKAAVKKVRIAMVTRAIQASSKTYQDVYSIANKFAAENQDGESFENAVIEQGLNKRSVPGLRVMSNNIAGIKYPRTLVRWAYNKDTEVGSVSQIFDMDGKYVIALLTEIEEEGYRPLAKVKAQVEREVKKEKRAEYIIAMLNKSSSFDDIKAKWDVEPQTSDVTLYSPNITRIGREPMVVGNVFSSEVGVVSAPIIGGLGVYVFVVESFNNAEAGDYTANKNLLKSGFARKVTSNSHYRALETASEIKDNRVLFY